MYKGTKSTGHTPPVVNDCEAGLSCKEDVEPWQERNRRLSRVTQEPRFVDRC